MKNLTTEARRHGEESGDRNEDPISVILSEAPRQAFPGFADGRGVEGSRHSAISRPGIKAFSREFPEASFVMHASSGSFDSPSSRRAGLGLAQDDRAIHRCRGETSGSVPEVLQQAGKSIHHALSIILAALREIFDESAYDRFLLRMQLARSAESYREFLRERESIVARKPRCC
jgi:hypothetical protein